MGLDWKKIREEYEARADPKELEGPFDAAGNLKSDVQAKVNKENAAKNRTSRAKPDALSRSEAGKRKSHTPNRTPPEARAAMIKLYREGVPMNEIGRRLGYHGVTVRGVLIQEGVHVSKKRSGNSG